MTKKGIIILIGFIALIVGGIIIGFGLSKKEYLESENTELIIVNEEINQEFNKIETKIFTADVRLEKSTDDKNSIKLSYYENQKIEYSVEGGVLKVTQQKGNYFSFILSGRFSTKSPEAIIYLSESTLDELNITTTTGDVEIGSDFTFNTATITVSTGDIDASFKTNGDLILTSTTGDITLTNNMSDSLILTSTTGKTIIEDFNVTNDVTISKDTGRTEITNMNASSLTAGSGTGKYKLKNVIIANTMKIKTGTGDVEFNACDAMDYDIETGTGDIEGTILTNKAFTVPKHTGDSNTPPADSTVNGTFKASTNTGDVDIKLKK